MSIIIPSPFPKEFEKIQLSIRSTIPGIRDIKKFVNVKSFNTISWIMHISIEMIEIYKDMDLFFISL